MTGVPGLPEDPADGARGLVDPPLSQPQQGQAGLRLASARGRPAGRPPPPRRTRRAAGAIPPACNAQSRGPAGSAGRASRSQARCASTTASDHAPPSSISSARCTRHCPRYSTSSGCESHQRLSAAVHSRARRTSNTSWHPSITVQYRSPIAVGETSAP